ncbi:two-component system sensor histidine kinase NtrB [Kiloniella sp. b19]|uniref:two-component system sensor histidine kinase NtrB n=1 Tax=Kiloniella sp. GXU_MW_B19 TaxID=3141326 RepID=UPI0031D95E4D
MASETEESDAFPDGWQILNSMADIVIVLDRDNRIVFLNVAAQSFLQSSLPLLSGVSFSDFIPRDHPLFLLIEQSRAMSVVASEHEMTLYSPRLGRHEVSASLAPIVDQQDPAKNGQIIVTLQDRSIAKRIHHQASRRNAVRSMTAMGAMLAHEIKNPLSGIRGAAQLLDMNASREDRQLTRLICDEADRIVGLVDRMEIFADNRPIEREAVNIHEVLAHVRLLAQSGFARHVEFEESYDPSLPDVWGSKDLLIQVFINLLKNAAEALPEEGGVVALHTRYEQGVKLVTSGSAERVDLPLKISVIDNGPGIPQDLLRDLFDPFVTTKSGGTGLGLSLVAKAVEAHSGVIEVSSATGRTSFDLNLPRVPASRR